DEMKTKDFEAYAVFFSELGVFLKEGVAQDRSHSEQLLDLMLFESTKTEPGKFTTLARYVLAMPEDQKEIHYLIGESRPMLENSPYVESLKAKGREVFLLTEPIDEFMMHGLFEYKGKKFKAADRGTVEGADVDEATKTQFKQFCDFLKEKLPDIKEARLSYRLNESAVCLVADEFAMSAHMERLMKRMGRGQEVPETKRILELNPRHATVKAVQELFGKDPANSRLEKSARLLYDQAVILEGSRLKDPAGLARSINELVQKDTGL